MDYYNVKIWGLGFVFIYTKCAVTARVYTNRNILMFLGLNKGFECMMALSLKTGDSDPAVSGFQTLLSKP